jgi:hypothetical protein
LVYFHFSFTISSGIDRFYPVPLQLHWYPDYSSFLIANLWLLMSMVIPMACILMMHLAETQKNQTLIFFAGAPAQMKNC